MTEASYVMVFLGEDVTPEEGARAEAILREKATGCELAVMAGGQPLYPYIISVE